MKFSETDKAMLGLIVVSCVFLVLWGLYLIHPGLLCVTVGLFGICSIGYIVGGEEKKNAHRK